MIFEATLNWIFPDRQFDSNDTRRVDRVLSNSPDKPDDQKVEGDLDAIAVRNGIRVLREGWRLVSVTIAVFIFVGIFLVNTTTSTYTAKFVIGPAPVIGGGATNVSGLGGMLGGFDLGMLGGTSETSDFQYFLELVGSVGLANRLDAKSNMLQQYYAQQWNRDEQDWSKPKGLMFWSKELIKKSINLAAWLPPSTTRLAADLKEAVVISKDTKTNFSTMRFEHESPEFAEFLLSEIVQEADMMIRTIELERSQKFSSYLEERLGEASQLDIRQSLISLLSDEERKLMMLSSDLPYAIRVIDGPVVSEKPTSPRPKIVLPLMAFLGFVVGSVMAILLMGIGQGRLFTTD